MLHGPGRAVLDWHRLAQITIWALPGVLPLKRPFGVPKLTSLSGSPFLAVFPHHELFGQLLQSLCNILWFAQIRPKILGFLT